MPRKLLVTGGAGFIGANFVRYWSEKHHDDNIWVIDALTYAGNLHNLRDVNQDNVQFLQLDINETGTIQELMLEEHIDTVVHFAAESHVDKSIEDPDVFLTTNILGTHSLLKAARSAWGTNNTAGHFHHVSTDEVYGELKPEDPAFSETTPYAPNSPYSASKAASDFLVRAYFHTYGVKVTTSNCSNNYGPFHFPEKLIPLVILNILQGKPIPVYGNGLNIRDWLYVDDHSLGIDMIINGGQAGETYNIGGCNEWTNIDIVNLICKTIDSKFAEDAALATAYPDCPAANSQMSSSLISFVEDRAGHDFRYAIDTKKINSELQYEPSITFEQGIEATINWYINNRCWTLPQKR